MTIHANLLSAAKQKKPAILVTTGGVRIGGDIVDLDDASRPQATVTLLVGPKNYAAVALDNVVAVCWGNES